MLTYRKILLHIFSRLVESKLEENKIRAEKKLAIKSWSPEVTANLDYQFNI